MRFGLLAAWALVALASSPSRALGFESGVVGIAVDASVSSTPVGDAIMAELGGEWSGIRSYRDERWLIQWDTALAVKAGYAAGQQLFLFLLGAHGLASAELGYRFVHQSHWSPYLGARLGADALILLPPAVSLSELNTINSVDGVGGLVASGLGRVDLGTSMLDGSHSLLLLLFLGEELDAPGVYTPGHSFTEAGFGLRFDTARSFFTAFEAFGGVSPTRVDSAHGLTDQTTRVSLDASFRKIFQNGRWLGASVWLTRDANRIVYSGGQSYVTGDAPTIGLLFSFGVRPWREE